MIKRKYFKEGSSIFWKEKRDEGQNDCDLFVKYLEWQEGTLHYQVELLP